MAWVDVVIIVIVVGLIIHGIATGLVRGAFDIAGIIFGYILAVSYSATVRLPQIFAFLIIFVVVLIAFSITGRVVSKIIHITPLGYVDRILGGVLGFVKGVIICFVLLLAVMLIRKDSRILSESQIARQITNRGLEASKFLPKPWYEWIEETFARGDVVLGNENYHIYF